jgi:hypothetical protein
MRLRLSATLPSTHDIPEPSTGKRPRAINYIDIWAESRSPKGIELQKNKHNNRIWYCKRCSFKQTAHNRIRDHLKTYLTVMAERPSAKKLAIQHSIESIFSKQSALAEGRDLDREKHLLTAINKPAFNNALIQLIASRNLPQSLPKWPKLYALLHSLNYMLTDILVQSRG